MINLCIAVVLGSCAQDDNVVNYLFDDDLEIRISRTSSLVEENLLSSVDAYLFSPDDQLISSYKNVQLNDGVCKLRMAYTENSRLLLFANGEGILPGNGFNSINEINEAVYSYNSESGTPQMFMTGEVQMTREVKSASATLTRGLARIDLKLHGQDMEISNVKISGLADRMYIFNKQGVVTPEGTSTYEVALQNVFSSSVSEGILYVLEQDNSCGTHTVSLDVKNGISNYSLKGKLPDVIERNKVYVVNVYSIGQSGRIDIETDLWENGDNSVATKNPDAIVDVEHSQLGEGVVYFEDTNDLKVKFTGTDNTSVRLNVPQGYIPELDGVTDEINLINDNNEHRLLINSKARMLGDPEEIVKVRMKSIDGEKEANSYLKITMEASPVRMTGKLKFDEARIHDFMGYVDGELGRMVLPEGWSAKLEFNDDVKWMKLDDETLIGYTRILAGWRPNDITANGVVQEVRLVLTDGSTGLTETYTIKRQNWSLPVVKINGTWWCKYNLRGNVKSFSDQVSIADDAVIKAKGDFASYLSSCPDDEFLRFAGDQYLGGKPDGLKPAMDSDGRLYFEGYDIANAVDFGKIPASDMAPDGFQIPTFNDYRFFTWGTNCNMGYKPNVFNNGMKDGWYARLRYDMKFRKVETENLTYGDVTIYKFWKEANPSEEWVIYGLGNQSKDGAGNVHPMNILFAISDRPGNSWGIEGYSQTDGSGNWYKYSGKSLGCTRMIRCIKTPVEYIY